MEEGTHNGETSRRTGQKEEESGQRRDLDEWTRTSSTYPLLTPFITVLPSSVFGESVDEVGSGIRFVTEEPIVDSTRTLETSGESWKCGTYSHGRWVQSVFMTPRIQTSQVSYPSRVIIFRGTSRSRTTPQSLFLFTTLSVVFYRLVFGK